MGVFAWPHTAQQPDELGNYKEPGTFSFCMQGPLPDLSPREPLTCTWCFLMRIHPQGSLCCRQGNTLGHRTCQQQVCSSSSSSSVGCLSASGLLLGCFWADIWLFLGSAPQPLQILTARLQRDAIVSMVSLELCTAWPSSYRSCIGSGTVYLGCMDTPC
jgi:hypothetical protein